MANGKTTDEILAEALKAPETPETPIQEPAPETPVVVTPEPDATPEQDTPPATPPEPPAPIFTDGEKPKKKYGKYVS